MSEPEAQLVGMWNNFDFMGLFRQPGALQK
jgi:hypothetical protein